MMNDCPGYGQPGCPSRYYCYAYESDELAMSSSSFEEYEYVCLCNKRLLFHGEDCVKNSPLFHLSIALKIVHAIYTLFIIIFVVEKLRGRRTAKDVMAASVLCCLLVGVTAFAMYVVEGIRAHPAFDDRVWEASWQTKMTSLLVFLSSLNVLTVGLMFLGRLQAVGVIRGKQASIWRMATLLSQSFSVAGCCIILTSASNAYVLVFALVSMLSVACLMAVAAFRTRHYLQLSLRRYPDRAHSNLQIAQRQLIMFVKGFCYWLSLCFFFGLSYTVRSAVQSASGTELNLLNVGMCLSLHQLGLVESDYFLLPEERPSIMYLIKCILEMLRWSDATPMSPYTYDSSCPVRHQIWIKDETQRHNGKLPSRSMKKNVSFGAPFPPSSSIEVRKSLREPVSPLFVTQRLPSSSPAAAPRKQRHFRLKFRKVEPDQKKVFPALSSHQSIRRNK